MSNEDNGAMGLVRCVSNTLKPSLNPSVELTVSVLARRPTSAATRLSAWFLIWLVVGGENALAIAAS